MLERYDQELAESRDKSLYQEILRKISNKEAQKAIRSLFDEEKIDEMLEYIEIYATSVASPDETDKSQNCTVITLRMKHRRMPWSVNGANNLAKALYRKENKKLVETIDRYTDDLVFTLQMQEIVETLSAAKAPKKTEKKIHTQTASRKAFKRAFGY